MLIILYRSEDWGDEPEWSIESVNLTADRGLDYTFGITDTVDNVGNLPSSCFNGYKVKVENSEDITVDDMYVEYQVSDNLNKISKSTAIDALTPTEADLADYQTEINKVAGPGVWRESNGFGINFQLDNKTMPHRLIRDSSTGTFQILRANWSDRNVGDDETNPAPSFVGSTINGLFFYRNRLGLLSGFSANLSRANKQLEFFNKSSLAIGDDDPIDIQAISNKAVTLEYVSQTSVGLLLFGTNEQFLLTTDSDILSPRTAKVNTVSQFDVEKNLPAQPLGTSTAFFSRNGDYIKSFELGNVSTTGSSETFEHTQSVPELIPSVVNQVVANPAASIIGFVEAGSPLAYYYRYYKVGKQVTTSWIKWRHTGNVRFHFFDDTNYYVAVENNNRVYLLEYNLNQTRRSGSLSNNNIDFDLCLDSQETNPVVRYNSTTKESSIHLQYNINQTDGKKLFVCILNTSDDKLLAGESSDLLEVSSDTDDPISYQTSTDDGNVVIKVKGQDLRGRDIIAGYNYNFKLELPVLYPLSAGDNNQVRSDTNVNLILHRMKVLTGPSGPIDYNIDVEGVPIWNNSITHTPTQTYSADSLNISVDKVHTIPIYQRNTNVNISISGDSPYPLSILSIDWEGRSTNNFYRSI